VKNKRFFRVLAVALTLVLLMVAIPAVPVSAAPAIDVDPDEGEIGEEIIVSGTEFPPNESLYVFFSRQQADVGDAIDDEVTVYSFSTAQTNFITGNLLFSFNIPEELDDGLDPDEDESVFGGIYYIYITYTTTETIRAAVSLRVIGDATITDFDPDEGTVGTEVEISGEGLIPGEAIIVEYDGDEIEIDSGDDEADNNGEFTLFIIVPDSEFGEHTITVRGEDSLAELEDIFTVEPEISVNPVSGEAGTVITVTGTGFDRRNGVDFSFGGTSVTNVDWLVEGGGRTNSDGTFAVNLTVPDVVSGNYTILAEDEDDNDIFATASFAVVVNTAVNVSPTIGKVGDSITVVGSSFGAGATATLYFDNVSQGTVLIGIDGSFTTNIDIPASTTGVHTIGVEDTAGRSATANVSVEAEMTMTPLTGIGGDGVSVSGTGFGASKDITIMYGDTAVTPATTITTNANGSFSGSFDVPAIPGGSYTVTVSDGTSDLTINFTVEAGATISPTSGEMGDAVQVSGHGFGANKTITILYGNAVIQPTAPITTNPTGSFSGSFDVPAIPGGTATLTISDGTIDVSVSLTVRANINLNPTSGEAGDGVAIAGYGFGANRPITILFNNTPVTPLAPIMTNASGLFSAAQFYVPASPGGTAIITINDGTTTVNASFTVETGDISISPKTSNVSPGHIGTEITISGDGYAAGAPIEVTYDGAVLATNPDETGSNGSFTAIFEIPRSVAGEHTIAVSINGVEAEQFTFIMESTAPLAPELITIFFSEKAEPPIRFDWGEVGDDSLPITYNLVIYTVEGSTEITVIEHLGLSVTEYTLTEAEVLKLVPLEKNEYYYWHVNAEDGAGNVSSWIAIDTFYIGGEGWPGWLMWLWIGLGGLAVFIFALWLGRRIAYSSY
jgi:hypothetical protein